jgi:RimJ/RimL family protein N-acetyltransferase
VESGAPRTSVIELSDGGTVLVAPLHVDDRGRFLSGLEHASAESLYKRFLTPIERFSESELRYLLDVDHRDHEALLAVDEETGEAVGVARFVRLPDAPDTAEAAVIVVDPWQGRGVGKALSRLLSRRARELGVARFEAMLLVDNEAMMALLESLGPVRTLSRDGAAIAVEVALEDGG